MSWGQHAWRSEGVVDMGKGNNNEMFPMHTTSVSSQ